jgi:hypothetical protein
MTGTRQRLVIVNASPVITDAEAAAMVIPIQRQIDEDFLPAWGDRAVAVNVDFATVRDIPDLPPSCWPIFLNRHSNDSDALGWHDQTDRIFARVFVGDCIRFGLDWRVTLSHEALEIILDPDIKRVWRMPDGRLAALEACDAVEADRLSYEIAGKRVSNFVLPAYFSSDRTGPFDFCGNLRGPCPELTPGGYMSIADRTGRNWTQVQAMQRDGLAGRRALLTGHRRQARAVWSPDELIETA